MLKSKTILWDWNGTLVNDTQICIDAINIMLRDRQKAEISRETYRDIFTFPVRDYYARAGFNFDEEPFEKPALEFIEHYEALIRKTELFPDARETLNELKNRAYQQMILSAMQQDFLSETVAMHSIDHFFSRISGIDNHYAAGKVDNARKLIAGMDGDAGEIIMIGDTIHDHEVGEELGIEVILVERGHQSGDRLRETGRTVVNTFAEVVERI